MPKRLSLALALVVAVQAAALAQTRFDGLAREGRLALDTGRLDEAIALLERAARIEPTRVAELAPDMAWTCIRRGNDAVREEDYELADTLFSRASATYPDFLPVFQNQWVFVRLPLLNDAIRAASEDARNADWNALADQVRQVLAVVPENPYAHFLMGIVYEFLDKSEQAKAEYRSVLGDGADLPNQSAKALRDAAQKRTAGTLYNLDLRPTYPPWEQSDPGDFQIFRKGPFKIYHHNRDLAGRLAAVLQYHLEKPVLDGALPAQGPFPDECTVYVFADQKAFHASGGKEMWAGGQSQFTLLNGKLHTAAIQLFQTTPELTETAAPHELAHVRLVASAHFYEGLPLWLQEGVASSAQSDYSKVLMAKKLREARKAGTLISIVKLMGMTRYPQGEASDLFYAESLATVEALVDKFGRHRFWRFVEALEKADQTQALTQGYGLRPVQVENLVLEWIDAHQ